MNIVFTCNNLNKLYRYRKALDNVSLTLEKGRIYGLVGNNGAGKTTLMRLMMGLSRPDGGEMTLLGESGEEGLMNARRRVGAFIETPIYNGMVSGKQNLEILCALYGVGDKQVPQEMLELVGLGTKGKQPVRHYSLGQRQRLGLAGAFAIDPEFLVLDEPLNGLDPSGVKEIRELLLQRQTEKGNTMLISSHNLAQLNLLATDYIILHEGKVIEEIAADELAKQCEGYLSLRVKTGQARAALQALHSKWEELELEQVGDDEVRLTNYKGNEQALYGVLIKANVEVEKLEQVGISLEDYFTRLTTARDKR